MPATDEADTQATECIKKISKFFEDKEKIALWMCLKNPHLGNVAPMTLISLGRGHKVIQFIESCLEGNLP